MRQVLHVKLSQQLSLTPQLQQSIRLLQLSTLELNQELESLMIENPLLEREDPALEALPGALNGAAHDEPAAASPDTLPAEPSDSNETDFDWFVDDAPVGARYDDGDESEYPQQAAESCSLYEHLMEQLGLTRLPERDKNVVHTLIGALDENGYLSHSLEEIVDMLPPELEIELEELQIGLRHLQNFDPVGVGARNLAECLALQLSALPAATPARSLALDIVRDHLDTLAARDFVRLKRQLSCNDENLRQAQQLIKSLNPHPGSAYGASDTRYIVPDIIVTKSKDSWIATLNPDAMPKLRINHMYAQILQSKAHPPSSQMSVQLQEARWLIKSVQQRFDTILRVAQAIVERQRHFFDHGDVAMRPLVLREIAETLDLHESTVSRVTTQKFMTTPRGILELKYFFGSHVSTEAGGACSATAIRALMKQLLSAEDSKKPLSDAKISKILGEQGIVVARRTIAKYRESLNLPSMSMRRAL